MRRSRSRETAIHRSYLARSMAPMSRRRASVSRSVASVRSNVRLVDAEARLANTKRIINPAKMPPSMANATISERVIDAPLAVGCPVQRSFRPDPPLQFGDASGQLGELLPGD